MSQTDAQPRQAAQAVGWRQSKAMQDRLTRWAVRLVLVAVGITFMMPFYWMLSTSLKADAQLAVFPPVWVPQPLMWSNYADAVTEQPFFLYLQNTAIICAATVVGVVLSSSVCAYGFSRIAWRGRNVLFFLMLSTLMLPYQVTMIPLFLQFRSLGWVNTYLPLTVPTFFGNAFFIFLFRQFYLGLPAELSDAARIDGCSELGIYGRIILPLTIPALAATAAFTFINTWNDFFSPLIYLTRPQLFTVSIALRAFIDASSASSLGPLFAMSVLSLLPVLGFFVAFQRLLTQGIVSTGFR